MPVFYVFLYIHRWRKKNNHPPNKKKNIKIKIWGKERNHLIFIALRRIKYPKDKFWYILWTHLHAASEVNISIIAHFRTRYSVPRYNNCQESMRNKEFSWILAHNLTSINKSADVHKWRNILFPGNSRAFNTVCFLACHYRFKI